MNTRSPVMPLSKFAKAPLFAGLALVLGSSLSWSSTFASPSAPFIGVGGPPGTRTGLRLGEQREALNRQLGRRGSSTPVAPNRPAGALVVSNCADAGAGSLRDAFLTRRKELIAEFSGLFSHLLKLRL